jgi:membrane-bound lytic murein transglycosylase B
MAQAGFGRLQRTAALVPLAMLSAAWSLSIAGVGITGSTASSSADGTLPDGSTVPDKAVEAPASVSTGGLAPALTRDRGRSVGMASVDGIPAVALAAYQRAETVINAADTTCHLPWQLVAAIGRVESDHGRVHGSHLDRNGLARPAILGHRLDGRKGTATIADTDAGLLDRDAHFDRAVGPMQFIPSTWSVVGVDADGDSQRNPQDIDDAALATAVYLCSGHDDLATDAGRRASVFRYNHSHRYVRVVLAFYDAYIAGVFTSVPHGIGSPGVAHPPSGGPGHGHGHGGDGGGGGTPTGEPAPTSGPTSHPTSKPTPQPTPTTGPSPTPHPAPTSPPPPSSSPTADPTVLPTALPTVLPTALPTVLPTVLPTTILSPVLRLPGH